MSRSRSMNTWLRSVSAPSVPPPSRYAADLLKAQDPQTPAKDLTTIYEDTFMYTRRYTNAESDALRIQLAQNPNTPREVLAQLASTLVCSALVLRNPSLILIALEDAKWCEEHLPMSTWDRLKETLEERKSREEQERYEWETKECDLCWRRVPLSETLCAYCQSKPQRPIFSSPRDEEDDDAIPF